MTLALLLGVFTEAFLLGALFARAMRRRPRHIPILSIAIGATRDDRVRVEMDGCVWIFHLDDAERFGAGVVSVAQWAQRRRA